MKKNIAVFISLIIGIIVGFFIPKSENPDFVYVTALVDREESAIRQNIWLLKFLDEERYTEAMDLVESNIDYRLKSSDAYTSLPANEGTVDIYKKTIQRANCALDDRSLTTEQVFDLRNLTNCSKMTPKSGAF